MTLFCCCCHTITTTTTTPFVCRCCRRATTTTTITLYVSVSSELFENECVRPIRRGSSLIDKAVFEAELILHRRICEEEPRGTHTASMLLLLSQK